MKAPPQRFRLIQDDWLNWYLIPAAEERTFWRWVDARAGKRRLPRNFNPVLVDPDKVTFADWRPRP